MPRSIAERARDPWWWFEQIAHAALGALVVAPMVWLPGPAGGALAGLVLALAREWEQRPVASWGDLSVDVAATVAGGALLGLAV